MHVYIRSDESFLMNSNHRTFILMNTIDTLRKNFACRQM